jgi:hypothetical protein
MYVKTEMPQGTRQAHCAACGLMFMSGEAFDIHRGIDTNLGMIGDNDDLRQDLGRCMNHAEMLDAGLALVWDDPTSDTNYDAKYGTEDDIALAEKMARARNNRN